MSGRRSFAAALQGSGDCILPEGSMGPIVYPKETDSYKNRWVAFSVDFKRIVGFGNTAREAHDMADFSNEPHAVLYFVPEDPDAIRI